jgi:CRP-like cAMP-binding protein
VNLQQTSSNELYELLSPDIAQELRKHEKYTTVRPGTKLVGHGDLPKDLIIVNTGSVEISLAAGSQMISIAVAGSGKVLGLRPVISGASSEIEATTLEECSVSFVPKQQFLEVLKQHPEIYIAIARILLISA